MLSHLSQCIKNSTDENNKCPIKILRNLQKTDVNITYQPLGANSNLKLVVYVDAAHANLSDEGSQERYLIFLVGDNNKNAQ